MTDKSTNHANGRSRRCGGLKQARQPDGQPSASWENRRDRVAGGKERQKSCPVDQIAARQWQKMGD
jgi:hypothetical protein